LRKKETIIIWPAYFDGKLSRKKGRRVPKKISLRDVKVEEIISAATDLNLSPILISGAYPKYPWQKNGAVLVKKHSSKTSIINDLAGRIRKNRT
jgi:signal recognition particle subunit SRP19